MQNFIETETTVSLLKTVFGERKISEFNELLFLNSGRDLGFFLKNHAVYGIAFGFFLAIASAFLKLEILAILLAFIAGFLLSFIAGFLFQWYVFEKNRFEKERLVPDILLAASAFPDGSTIEEILEFIALGDFGLIGLEFKKCVLEIKNGNSVENSLNSLAERNKSRTVSRAANLLVQGYKSGAEISKIFRETAEDILETNSILRERNAAMVVEKYTLLSAGGIIVPLVLGLIAGMVSKLDFSSLAGLSFGLSVERRIAIFDAALLSNQIYLIEFALIASIFTAFQSSDKKKALVYAMVLIPSSLLVYNIAKNLK